MIVIVGWILLESLKNNIKRWFDGSFLWKCIRGCNTERDNLIEYF